MKKSAAGSSQEKKMWMGRRDREISERSPPSSFNSKKDPLLIKALNISYREQRRRMVIIWEEDFCLKAAFKKLYWFLKNG